MKYGYPTPTPEEAGSFADIYEELTGARLSPDDARDVSGRVLALVAFVCQLRLDQERDSGAQDGAAGATPVG